MQLQIILKKDFTQGATLTIKRPDGSLTWSRLKKNIEFHDLGHIIIEKELQLKDSFFGLVAKGANIQDFELPKDEKPEYLLTTNLTNEAIVTEHMVNLLTARQFNSKTMDFCAQLREILTLKKLAFPKLLDKEIAKTIEAQYNTIVNLWNAMDNKEEYHTTFTI